MVSPQGQTFTQKKAKELSQKNSVLTLVCGRYEGFDERIRSIVDEEISGGDFVCMGGEVISMAIIESVSRLRPGFLGNQNHLKMNHFLNHCLNIHNILVPQAMLAWMFQKNCCQVTMKKLLHGAKNRPCRGRRKDVQI